MPVIGKIYLQYLNDIFNYIFKFLEPRTDPEQKTNKDCSGFNRGICLEADPDHSWFFEEFLTFQLSMQI